MRPLWRHYFANTNGLIFVVDSNDRDRIQESKEELFQMLREDELRNVCVLVFANKQDLPNAMTIEEISELMQLHQIKDRPWHIQAACAVKEKGLYEGLDWLVKAIAE